MSTITLPYKPVNAKSRPLAVALTLTINGQSYDVTPLAHAPGSTRSYRLAKVGGDEAVYDVDAYADRVECSCPSYRKTHEGTSSLCKHSRGMIMVGLLEAPAVEAAPAPYAEHVAKLDAIAAAEAVVRSEAEAPAFDRDIYRAQNAVAEGRALWVSHRHLHTSEPASKPAPDHARDIVLIDDDGTALETPGEMDRRHVEEHAALVAVCELRADWLCDKPSEAECCPDEEPMPCRGCLTHDEPPADDERRHTFPADLDGTDWDDDHVWNLGADVEPEPEPEPDREVLALIENGAELEAEGEAPLADATPECFEAVAQGRADWAREFGWVPCPGFVTRENAIDLMTDDAIANGWAEYRDRSRAEAMRARKAAMDAPHVEPEPRTLEEQVRDHARELRAIGSPLHDLLAERAESLADQVRLVEATTVAQFRDRLDAMLDAEAARIEARRSTCC